MKWIKDKYSKAKTFVSGLAHVWYMKYLLVCVIGVLIIGFLDENSILSHINNMRRINDLKEEIKVYEDLNKSNKAKIRQLQENPKMMEKIARERYFMKADDEDIFVLSDDNPQQFTISTNENEAIK
jgi:cell division protein FtsB